MKDDEQEISIEVYDQLTSRSYYQIIWEEEKKIKVKKDHEEKGEDILWNE